MSDNILFIDTETTGFVKDWANPSNPLNARMVQIGMMVCSCEGRVLKTFSHMVKPDGYVIPDVVTNQVHGISTEMATKYGCPVKFALQAFQAFASNCSTVVAHNLKFDKCIISGELERLVAKFPGLKEYCTMLESTNVCCMPSKRGGYKWPKLSEAYDFFFQEELKDAHDALTDVMACKRVFFEGLRQGVRAGTLSVNGSNGTSCSPQS